MTRPRDRRRVLSLALAASLSMHALFVLGMSGAAFLRLEPPIPIEVLPMKRRPPSPPALPSLDPPKRPPPRPDGQGKHVPPRPPTPSVAKKPAPPPAEDLHVVGPATANITLVLRGPLLARSPYRDGVDHLLSLLPDYHTLLDGTGLSPFDDLEALLIATPDPRDVTATFLAARHRGDPRIGVLATRTLGNGDPRQFRALGDDLMLLGRPDDLARITAAEAGDTRLPPAELAEASRWLDALRRFDQGGKEAALQLTVADLGQLIRMKGELPLPHTIRLAMSADASPATRLICLFETSEQAERFASLWPLLRVKIGDSVPGFGGVLDDLALTRRDKEVELVGRLPEAQVRLAFAFLSMFAPSPSPSPSPSAVDRQPSPSPSAVDRQPSPSPPPGSNPSPSLSPPPHPTDPP